MAAQDYDSLLEEQLDGWQPDHVGTLVFVRQHDEVLLIRKKRGHGAGKINGPGGKIDPGETAEQTARRELRAEAGVSAREWRPLGSLSPERLGLSRRHGAELLLEQAWRRAAGPAVAPRAD